MPPFATDLNRHLATYKAQRLGVRQAGVFRYRGRDVRHAHILPIELKWLNILEAYRSEIRRYLDQHQEVRLQTYFHHLNSSQAFAFNLFFPFLSGDHSSALLRAMGLAGEVGTWRLEHVVDQAEGTNVDVSWCARGHRRPWTHCEVKLTEGDFGTAPNDEEHLAKLDRVYRPVLAGHCDNRLLQPQTFLRNYQVMRNLWLAARAGHTTVVFLLPRRNERLWRRLEGIMTRVGERLAGQIRVVATEDVLAHLIADGHTPPHLHWYAKQLAEKYVLPEAPR